MLGSQPVKTTQSSRPSHPPRRASPSSKAVQAPLFISWRLTSVPPTVQSIPDMPHATLAQLHVGWT